MKRANILILIKNGVAGDGNAGDRLQKEDFDAALDIALKALEESRPYILHDSITLTAGEPLYDAPAADFVGYAHSDWGTAKKSYFNGCETRPHIMNNKKKLHFSPAPTAAQLTAWGSTFAYFYRARHVLTDTPSECTLNDEDQGILILRAMAELMRILASRNVVDPVQLHRGIGNVPTSSTPGQMYKDLMLEYRRQAQGGG